MSDLKFCVNCNRKVPEKNGLCAFCRTPVRRQSGDQNKSKSVRFYTRVAMPIKINYQVLLFAPGGDNLTLEGKIKDISSSGLHFETIADFEMTRHLLNGAIMWTEFEVPGEGVRVKVQGEIRRVVSAQNNVMGIGIMFLNLSRHCKSAIDNYILKNAA